MPINAKPMPAPTNVAIKLINPHITIVINTGDINKRTPIICLILIVISPLTKDRNLLSHKP